MTTTSTRSRLLIGGVVALVLIAATTWQSQPLPAPADPGQWLVVVAVVLGYLAFCAPFLLSRRQVPAPFRSMPIKPFSSTPAPARNPALAAPSITPNDERMLVVHASQTGFGEQLAAQTVASLQQAGLDVQSMSLGDLDIGTLLLTPRILFIASTTGEGDPPDPAYAFVRNVMSQRRDLSSLQYGLLALGDREYEFFCGFGRQLDTWLREQGALPMFDMIEVDNGDAATLRNWQHQIGALTGAVDLPDWEAPTYSDWRLSERVLLNPGSIGGPVFHVALSNGGVTRWAAGDIVEVGPRNSPADVDAFLAVLGINGNSRIGSELLKDRLGRAALPSLDDAQGLSARALADAVTDLPHREYSIASVPEDGAVHLLIRQVRRPDGRLGIGGGWLTEHAAVGSDIKARIRANPNFRAPDDGRPLILIGNGTGIAGLRALLRERVQMGRHRNWLLFGERSAAHDFYYGNEIRGWLESGQIERLDLAFSRDQAERIHVQRLVADAGAALREWVGAGASIYVCGSLEGMAPGVHAALLDALGSARLDQLIEQGRYRRDVY